MRKTKIICTIGPASEDPEVIKKLINAGMNVARFNMSHGIHSEHAKKMATVRSVAQAMGKPVGILLDTKGPEVRVKTFKGGKVQIKDGQTFTFTTDECEGDNTKVSANYKDLHRDLVPGDTIMVNDGLVQFTVKEIKGHDIICKCVRGGYIFNQKSMNFPKKNLSMPFISENDRSDLLFAVEQKVNFVAASFVSNKMNVVEMRQLLNHAGGHNIEIIAKIENHSGVENIDDIYTVADGAMVARGDMGVEIPFAQLPGIQRRLIEKARHLGKRIIVATEMLESMIENPRPTRAETSDVATAVTQGASAIMLSGETAAGKYPVQCVQAMSNIALEAEKDMDFYQELKTLSFKIDHMSQAICHAACNAALNLNARLIVTFTQSGNSARMVSRFRPGIPIVGCTTNPQTFSTIALSWGVIPMMVEDFNKSEDLYDHSIKIARDLGCKEGDIIVVTCGIPMKGDTNIIKIITLK
ncbi:pyruvate kinase [Tritrichomonas foetus]|uniref:Pyruvate kinase n=1 Tax=Tritrichomonas foetus TaxID=1144522 RepID=A0A1J4KZA4_9EUKA|nr:pyruvate kinase [Tritrichomonas foetus]|eukprot:OHT16583.1 pyruvate kinase [Tritrichomonas foetus]